MKNTLKFLTGLAICVQSATLAAANMNDAVKIPMVAIANSIEAEQVSVSGETDQGFSYVIVRACATCKVQTFKTASNAEYLKGGNSLSMDDIEQYKGKPGTVFYDVETEKVTRVIYFQYEAQ